MGVDFIFRIRLKGPAAYRRRPVFQMDATPGAGTSDWCAGEYHWKRIPRRLGTGN